MGKVLYLDCSSGASGDMMLGALLDLGVRLDDLREALAGLLPAGAALHADRVLRSGISATLFSLVEPERADGAHHPGDSHARAHHPGDGHDHSQHPGDDGHHSQQCSHEGLHPHRDEQLHHPGDGHSQHPGGDGAHHPGGGDARHEGREPSHHHHRQLDVIHDLIDRAAFSAATRTRAKMLYARLAGVEAEIHQVPLDRVFLHEVGALDSVVDIVGAVWALDSLGVDRIVASPLNVGGGRVQTAHGLLSVPAPATLRLLDGVPVFSDGTPIELLTPTGALLVTGYATSYGPMPAMTVIRTGYGAGGRDLATHPNVLRAVLGEEAQSSARERVAVIACNLDDMNPQVFSVVMDQLYAEGALDVFFVPVVMKKNRPGTLVTVLAPPARREAMLGVLFRESTTIGVRYTEMERECLDRETISVDTPYGAVRVKIARRLGVEMNAAPEFDDCVLAAKTHRVAVKHVQAAAQQAYAEQCRKPS